MNYHLQWVFTNTFKKNINMPLMNVPLTHIGSRTKNTLSDLQHIMHLINNRKFDFDGIDAESLINDIKADISELLKYKNK